MANNQPQLDILSQYINTALELMRNPQDRHKVEGILERTIDALESGATTEDIKKTVVPYFTKGHAKRYQ